MTVPGRIHTGSRGEFSSRRIVHFRTRHGNARAVQASDNQNISIVEQRRSMQDAPCGHTARQYETSCAIARKGGLHRAIADVVYSND